MSVFSAHKIGAKQLLKIFLEDQQKKWRKPTEEGGILKSSLDSLSKNSMLAT